MRTVACEKLVGFPDRKSEGNHGIADDNGFFVHEQYLPPMLNSLEESNPPDDDFSASPHCGAAMAVMRVWGRGCDSITGAWNVSAATISRLAVIVSAPDDHFSASPHRRVSPSRARRIVRACSTQLSVLGLYLPPVFRMPLPFIPPQTIISVPVHTAVGRAR
jgi:hypothetical protein